VKKKKIVILGGVAAVAVIAVVVKLVFFKPTFLYAGTIEAVKVDVSSRITSVISELRIKQGDHVKLGQVLLTMSCEDIRAEAELADQNFIRTEKLYHQGSQPKEAFDQSKNKRDLSDLALTWCQVTSPLSGVALTKYHEAGEMVTPTTKLFTLANVQDVFAYIYIPQPYVARLRLGQNLQGFIPELNMRFFDGTIIEIGEQAEFTPKNVQTREERERLIYAVKVSFKNDDETLKPGMAIEVKIPEEKGD